MLVNTRARMGGKYFPAQQHKARMRTAALVGRPLPERQKRRDPYRPTRRLLGRLA
jgi:hypothetical protein